MKHYITIALCTFLSQMCTAQVMMLFSQDSLTGIVSPLDLDSLFYWFAADVGVTDSLGGAIATDEGVGTWNDLSGNGHHVTQSTDGARPVYKATGGPGGYPAIQFDGTDDFLASSAHWWGSDDLTVFAVMKFANATRDVVETIFRKGDTPISDRQFSMQGNRAGSYSVGAILYKDGTSSNYNTYEGDSKSTLFRVIVHTSNGAGTYTLHIDSVSKTYNNITTGTGDHTILNSNLSGISIGCANPAGTPVNFLQGSISEIIVYSRALSDSERAAIELYLNRKYDLY